MRTKNITIIGLGGVGGYFGFKLAQSNKNNPDSEITFAARGETYEIVKENGLTLLSEEAAEAVIQPDHLISSLSDIKEPAHLILVCVKEYDLERVCHEIKDKVTGDTILIALMNGADIYDRVRKIITTGTILPACVYVASHIKTKGIVEHKGATGKIILGKDPHNKNTEAEWVIKLLKDSGADVIYKEDNFADIWTKFFFIASFGMVSARYNSSIGQICEEGPLKERARKIMEEIKAITDNLIIGIPSDIIEKTFEKAESFPYGTPTSLQLDVNAGKERNELDLFAGAIINYGTKLNTDTSETQLISNEIKGL
ncbi:ketopantoate reductase family protein [Flavobacterium humi]|uniref:2-dehydropantoate 2-reductase n=1 Tax=Flavobacterium humi TaxID=2562683 RepID=A0A4Z0LD13_9FLAO|nr:2-dehydropantoate 2-reductase [Flavobacterium humi]TGD59780.1 2-dehydropantoate 2-reductase [Flavobacterium humi]